MLFVFFFLQRNVYVILLGIACFLNSLYLSSIFRYKPEWLKIRFWQKSKCHMHVLSHFRVVQVYRNLERVFSCPLPVVVAVGVAVAVVAAVLLLLCSQMPSMGRWLPRRLCPRWRLCRLLCRRSTAHNHNKIKQMNGTDTAATATAATATAATSSQQQHHHRNSNSFAEKCACMWACVGNFVACIPGAQIFRESWKRTFSHFHMRRVECSHLWMWMWMLAVVFVALAEFL